MTYTFECPACHAHVSTDIRPTRAPICASQKHPRARQMIPTSRHTPWEAVIPACSTRTDYDGGVKTDAPRGPGLGAARGAKSERTRPDA